MTGPAPDTSPRSVVVFVGPTIDAAAVEEALASEVVAVAVEAPAARGDVLRAANRGVDVIALVDGFYESVPSTWHKEILWAIEQGVRVYGASSMGAIRAAECAAFGMIGVGSIYEGFAAGVLDDDDVALAHAAAEDGYRPLSEAMVNVRATLDAAQTQGALDAATAAVVDAVAKALFYPDRQWTAIECAAIDAGADSDAVEALRAWRRHHGTVDAKRSDAEALAARIRSDLASGAPSPPVRHATTVTVHFERMRAEEQSMAATGGLWRQPLQEEVLVQPDRFADVAAEAVRRRYARTLAAQAGARPDVGAVDAASDRFRRRLGLLEPEDFWAWLDAHEMSFDAYTALVHREAAAHLGSSMLPTVDHADVADVLRRRGLWHEVRDRSVAKTALLRAAGVEESGHLDGAASAGEALTWFCRARLGLDGAPDERVIEELARRLGFDDADALGAAALREHHAVHLGLDAERSLPERSTEGGAERGYDSVFE